MTPKLISPSDLAALCAEKDKLWLFLDYDGTLSEFAPTPDDIRLDQEVVALLSRLARLPGLRLSVISGRRLAHLQALLPLKGITLAGTYGIELQTDGGQLISRLDYATLRPGLDELKPLWEELIAGQPDYYLEDKGWSLALHARYAQDDEAEAVLSRARAMVPPLILEKFLLVGGHKFMEIAPPMANKRMAIEYLLTAYAWPKAQLVYAGDDDKDELAFQAIAEENGISVVVAPQPIPSQADYRLESPAQVRAWLNSLAEQRERLTQENC